MRKKRGQVTIFIIIAIVLVGITILFFSFRGSIFKQQIPSNIQPAYNSFLSCIGENTNEGIRILESQGGYIYAPDFEAGSEYMPFSSQLNFFGTPIPYWYYVSGNNLQRSQVPSQSQMEQQLSKFIEAGITKCSLDEYSSQGYLFNFGEPSSATTTINANDVQVSLNMDVSISLNGETTTVKSHSVDVASNLGRLYNSATKVYDYEQKNLFLENYGVDVLRLYAPVDGTELSCSPLSWSADQIFNNLENALEQNTFSLKASSSSDAKTKDEKYFYTQIPVDEQVTFLNSKSWPHTFEVSPSEDNFMISNPVGNQAGLGFLGFCYVPYHFVYDVKYPVLIQVKKDNEIFQFPVAVIIQGNAPREPYTSDEIISNPNAPETCSFKNTDISINLYDDNLNKIDGNIYYECSGETCYIGNTTNGVLNSKVPQCINGNLIAKSEGFEDSSKIISSLNSSSADLILNKFYSKSISLYLDDKIFSGNAVIVFSSDKTSRSVAYPGQKEVKLSEGIYNMSVYIYKNTTVNLNSTTERQCTQVPKSGIAGALGLTEEKCFEFEIPSSVVTNALAGGGSQSVYITKSELESQKNIEIKTSSFPNPNSLKQIQDNYILFDSNNIEVNFI